MRVVATSSDVPLSLYDTFEQSMQHMGGFEHLPHVAVAVSGGADSMATVLCAKRWALACGGQVTALIVDHGLRSTSSHEAKQTQQWLQAHGIASEILVLSLRGTKAAIQEIARDARYQALTQWCKDHRVLHLLLGHHRDDQAETVLFRWMRHSGFAGLAGMGVIRELSDVRLLRPLLHASKQDCCDFLRVMNQPWIDDASNQNPAFSRVALRQFLQTQHANQRLALVADKLGDMRAAEERTLADLLVRHVTLYAYGVALVSDWQALPEAMLRSVMSRLLVTVNGSANPVRELDVARLAAWVRTLQGPRRTLHGCVIERQKTSALLVYRERPHAGTQPMLQSYTHWDRFIVQCEQPHPEYMVSALTGAGWRSIREQATCSGPSTSRIAGTLPAIWHLDEVLCVPHIHYYSNQWRWSEPKIVFNPAKPLAGAPFYAMNKGQ